LRAVTSLHAPTTSIGLPAPSRAAGNSCCAGYPLRDPNWLLGGGFCRSRCWLGYHYRIGNRLRNIKFLDGVKQAAQEASDRTKEQWKSILDNIPRGGTDTGAHVKETLSAHAREAQAAMRSSREAGLKVMHTLTQNYATLVSGVLIGLSEALEHGKPKTKH